MVFGYIGVLFGGRFYEVVILGCFRVFLSIFFDGFFVCYVWYYIWGRNRVDKFICVR